MKKLEKCPLCGRPSSEARLLHVRSHDSIMKCLACGLMYANPQRTSEELAELYREGYYPEEDTGCTGALEREYTRNRILYATVLHDLLRRYPRLLEKRPGARSRVLDFGCGRGYFLAECKKRGFEPTGIEFSETAARYARENLGIPVLTSPDAALAALPPSHYDLITAWEVIEHTRRPREILRHLVRALAEGGVLALAVPNPKCWRYLIEREKWFNIRNPTHLIFFNKRNLTGLLESLGLARVSRPFFWGGRPGFGPVANIAQYAARAAGLGSDLRIYAEK